VKNVKEGAVERLLTTNDVATYLQLSPKTLRNWRSSGKGPPFLRFGCGLVRYRLEDVEKWLLLQLHRTEPQW
jgi:excisionase family DNA binding protein